ncbi:hypothetical protein N9Q00_02785, partial [Amylibacter sp.]|nr:hypothetical protein [Amylibacter sp.]
KLEDTKKEVSEIVETAKEEANATNELSASNILLADNITDEGSKSLNTSNTEEKELKENIFQIEKLSELQEIALKANTFLMEYNKDQAGKLMRYKLRLTVKGSEIDTSLVSKSIFGFENSSSIDISMSIGSSQAALDFIIDEENTKINLHFSDDASVNKDFASNIPELILDASEISGAFLVRIIDDGSNNIQSGDFAQILERLDSKDVALVGAFCSVIQSISVDKNTFIKSVTQNIPDESKDGFSTSPLVSDGVINIINSHATACVGELEKVNNTKASFDIPNLFDFEETGEALLENSTENILEKSRAELKAKEQKNAEVEKNRIIKKKKNIERMRLDMERRAKEKRLAEVQKQRLAEKEETKKRTESVSKPANGTRPNDGRCLKSEYDLVKGMFENAGYTFNLDFDKCTVEKIPGYSVYRPKKLESWSHVLHHFSNPFRAQGSTPRNKLFCYKYMNGKWILDDEKDCNK